MKTRALLILIVLFFSVTGWGNGRYRPDSEETCTKDQLVGFVKEAVAFAKIYGKREALREFKSSNGLFLRGELYIYAYDFKGKVISHGENPSLVGKNLWNLKDPNGVLIIQEMIKRINRQGKGWLEFYWFHPISKKIQKKVGYFERINTAWWIGSGYYVVD